MPTLTDELKVIFSHKNKTILLREGETIISSKPDNLLDQHSQLYMYSVRALINSQHVDMWLHLDTLSRPAANQSHCLNLRAQARKLSH